MLLKKILQVSIISKCDFCRLPISLTTVRKEHPKAASLASQANSTLSVADEVKKLADLLDMGFIS